MAVYDSRTDKIYGCKKGSLAYYHELGHREWYKKGIEQSFDIYALIMAMFAIFSTSFQFWLAAQVFSVFMMFYYFLPETHAWIYAFQHHKRR